MNVGLQVCATMPSVHFRRDKICSSFLKGSDAAALGVNSSVGVRDEGGGTEEICRDAQVPHMICCLILYDMIGRLLSYTCSLCTLINL